MSPSLVIIGVIYGALSFGVSSFGVTDESVEALHEDLRAEVGRGGAKAVVCRVIQPIIWLLTLPIQSISSALALAALLVCTGALL